MTKRLCRCGAFTDAGLCDRCRPTAANHAQSTADRGYGHDWRQLSLAERQKRPLCEVCDARGIASPSTQLHHIEKIRDSPNKRLCVDNTLAVCVPCHNEVESMSRLELVTFLETLQRENQ